jgi:hypothetical protein
MNGEVLGATQILKKIKAESKENCSRLVAEPPWPLTSTKRHYHPTRSLLASSMRLDGFQVI